MYNSSLLHHQHDISTEMKNQNKYYILTSRNLSFSIANGHSSITLFGYGLLIISVQLQVLRQKRLVLRNICVILSKNLLGKVFRIHVDLQTDGFSVKLKRERKKAQTQLIAVRMVSYNFFNSYTWIS